MIVAEIVTRVEIPHVVYPKGPIRTVKSMRHAEDEVAGAIVIVDLGPCGHEVTLVGNVSEDLIPEMIVRCPICFYEAHDAAGRAKPAIEPVEGPVEHVDAAR